MENIANSDKHQSVKYDESNMIHLEDMEHIRLRPGMYIGKLGDGSHSDDGIYVLIKESIDNSVDEFRMGEGKIIEVRLQDTKVRIRDYGRGIPLGSIVDAVSKLNTGSKYDSKAFKKSVGMNGVGTKAVNALSLSFIVEAFRDGKKRRVEFCRGKLTNDSGIIDNILDEPRGTLFEFIPDSDSKIFGNYVFHEDFIEPMLRNYVYLNTGLTIVFNDKKFISKNGLLDLLNENISADPLYPIIHLKGEDIEIAFTHTDQHGEEYYSFVNGQYTSQGGTHQSAFKESIARTIKDYYAKNMDFTDVRNGIVAVISINVEEPVFESQTKIKLGSKDIGPDGPSVSKFINDFVKNEVDNYLHKNSDTSNILLDRIQESERERKAIAGVTKKAREFAKKANLHNRKLRDCRFHLNDIRGDKQEESCIFITEGDSASGSITKSRDVNTQAVFSLRGKPLNSFGLPRTTVYENEEFNLLQAALNIEEGLDGLRYNKVIIATDADVDGMHIRLLMLTFFLQFFPELVKKGHVYILQTPLFRVRKTTKKSKEDIYCYSEEERLSAINKLSPNPEITRFKGLGEISPDEFKGFIGENIRLDQVKFSFIKNDINVSDAKNSISKEKNDELLSKAEPVNKILEFYMGKNTSKRQEFIIDNLVVDEEML